MEQESGTPIATLENRQSNGVAVAGHRASLRAMRFHGIAISIFAELGDFMSSS